MKVAILVGDPIIAMRALGPDPCGVLPPPVGATVTAAAGGGLFAATWYVVLTYLTPWGESSRSREIPVVLAGGNLAFQVTIPNLAPGATAVRAYFGIQTGLEAQYQQQDVSTIAPGAQVQFTVSAWGAGAIPPQKSSAYLPDSDGGYVSAAIAYR